MLEVKKLNKSYGEFKALDDVSFKAEKGKITGFLGPNGAGKTTTMRIITGFLASDSGSVLFSGKKASSVDFTKELGYLPENNPLYLNLRVDEFLKFSAELKEVTDLSEIKEIVEKCGLEKVQMKIIGTLSKGYKQRVGLAKALIGSPKYVVLDEPTTGLDPNQKKEILKLIKSLAKDKVIIFSSHVLTEVQEISDKLIIINEGKLVAEGKPHDLVKKHFKNSVIQVTTDATKTKFESEVKKLKEVSDINEIKSKATKMKMFEVRCTNPEETAIEVYKMSVKNKWVLSELHTHEESLDNLFEQLTK